MRGRCAFELGRYDAALADFTETYKVSPDFNSKFLEAEVLVWIGRTHVRRNDFPRAVASYTLAMASPEFSPEVAAERAFAYQEMRRYREAVADLRTFVKGMPKSAVAYSRLALLLAACPDSSLRDARAALELANVAQELESGPLERCQALSAAAAAHAAAGDFQKAVELQNQALGAAPESQKSDLMSRLDTFRRDEPFLLPSEPDLLPKPSTAGIVETLFKDMVRIEGGTVESVRSGGSRDQAVRKTVITPFLMGRHEVTNRQWATIMGQPLEGDPQAPREYVSWHDCQEFLRRLNALIAPNARVFRLPTESEWEFAARAGEAGDYFFGDSEADLKKYAWYGEKAGAGSHPVGSLEPNPLGLHDIYGSVGEWCQDGYRSDDERADPFDEPPEQSDFYVFRGGNRFMSAAMCRSSARAFAPAKERRQGLGVRLVAEAPASLEELSRGSAASPEGLDRLIREQSEMLRSSRGGILKDVHAARLVELYYTRAYARYEEGRHQQALDDFGAVLAHSNNFTEARAASARCHLAWILATCEDDSIRDGYQALQHAERALGISAFGSWLAYTAAAAAHAELGDFDRAVQRAEQSCSQAPENVAAECRERLAQYKAQKPVRGGALPLRLKD